MVTTLNGDNKSLDRFMEESAHDSPECNSNSAANSECFTAL
jgi:hypothetical protein